MHIQVNKLNKMDVKMTIICVTFGVLCTTYMKRSYRSTSDTDTILNETSTSMDKTLLDKITEDGMVKCYSESEILNRKIVGRGGFGVVYKAMLKHTGVTVAMKMLMLDVYSDEQE